MSDFTILKEDLILAAQGTVSDDQALNSDANPATSEVVDSPTLTIEPSVVVAEPDNGGNGFPATDSAPVHNGQASPPETAVEAAVASEARSDREPADSVSEVEYPIADSAPADLDFAASYSVITTDDTDLARAAIGRDIPDTGALGSMPAARQSVQTLAGGEANLFKIMLLDEPEHALDEHSLACALDQFVEPQDTVLSRKFGELLSDFLADDGHMIVVVGAPGTGRTTAATALLARIPSSAGRALSVEYLHLADRGRIPRHRIARKSNRGYLLQLPEDEVHVDSEDSYQVPDSLGGELMEAKALMAIKNSYLVVVTTPAQWERVSRGVPSDAVWMYTPPLGVAVAERWLPSIAPGITVRDWLEDRRIVELFSDQPPREAMKIARLIRDAHNAPVGALAHVTEGTDNELNRRVTSVIAARKSWRADLLQWHKRPSRTSLERNFMLTIAGLPPGSPLATIHRQTLNLCERFEEGDVETRGQKGPGVIALVDAAVARLAEDRKVSFERPGWGSAVLDYFWLDRPTRTEDFLNWLAAVPKEFPKQKQADFAQQIATSMLRWMAERRNSEPLAVLLTVWGADALLRPVAVELATAAALQPALERDVHAKLYQWSGKDGDAVMRRLVIEMCGGRYGTSHLERALVRLRRAALPSDASIDEALTQTSRNLWRAPEARGTLMRSIRSWCEDTSGKAFGTGRKTFAAVASIVDDVTGVPSVMTLTADEPGFAARELASSWRALLAVEPQAAAGAIKTWLDAAAARPGIRDEVFSTLRLAVDIREHDLGVALRHHLHDLIHEWRRTLDDPELREGAENIDRDLVDLLHKDWAAGAGALVASAVDDLDSIG